MPGDRAEAARCCNRPRWTSTKVRQRPSVGDKCFLRAASQIMAHPLRTARIDWIAIVSHQSTHSCLPIIQLGTPYAFRQVFEATRGVTAFQHFEILPIGVCFSKPPANTSAASRDMSRRSLGEGGSPRFLTEPYERPGRWVKISASWGVVMARAETIGVKPSDNR